MSPRRVKKLSTMNLSKQDQKEGFLKETITDYQGQLIEIKKPNGDKLANYGPVFKPGMQATIV